MDGTPIDDLITELQETDPAEAADAADGIAARLAAELENSEAEASDS
jgi:hypothetical protein